MMLDEHRDQTIGFGPTGNCVFKRIVPTAVATDVGFFVRVQRGVCEKSVLEIVYSDLRRLLMWDDFVDHPMRRDYVDPDDYEYEPTAHDEVLARAQAHRAKAAEAAGQEGASA